MDVREVVGLDTENAGLQQCQHGETRDRMGNETYTKVHLEAGRIHSLNVSFPVGHSFGQEFPIHPCHRSEALSVGTFFPRCRRGAVKMWFVFVVRRRENTEHRRVVDFRSVIPVWPLARVVRIGDLVRATRRSTIWSGVRLSCITSIGLSWIACVGWSSC